MTLYQCSCCAAVSETPYGCSCGGAMVPVIAPPVVEEIPPFREGGEVAYMPMLGHLDDAGFVIPQTLGFRRCEE